MVNGIFGIKWLFLHSFKRNTGEHGSVYTVFRQLCRHQNKKIAKTCPSDSHLVVCVVILYMALGYI